MDRITEAFGWPVRDPAWLTKLLVIGLTLLIPVAGAINGLGWMLAALERLRAGERTLPPANLSYIARGSRLFVVELIYGLAVALLTAVVYVPSVLVLQHEGSGAADAGLVSLAILLSLLSFSIGSLGSLALTFATPAIVLAVERGGISEGLRLTAILRQARGSLSSTLIAGIMLIAAGFVGSVGVAACGVGLAFSTAYSLAMQAWIIRSFELGTSAIRTA